MRRSRRRTRSCLGPGCVALITSLCMPAPPSLRSRPGVACVHVDTGQAGAAREVLSPRALGEQHPTLAVAPPEPAHALPVPSAEQQGCAGDERAGGPLPGAGSAENTAGRGATTRGKAALRRLHPDHHQAPLRPLRFLRFSRFRLAPHAPSHPRSLTSNRHPPTNLRSLPSSHVLQVAPRCRLARRRSAASPLPQAVHLADGLLPPPAVSADCSRNYTVVAGEDAL